MQADVFTKASIYGATLLSGLLYCAHCGHRLVGGYCTKQQPSGAYHRPIYRCYNGSVKAKNCTGQSVYSARKIEGAVLETVQQYFQSMTCTVDATIITNGCKKHGHRIADRRDCCSRFP